MKPEGGQAGFDGFHKPRSWHLVGLRGTYWTISWVPQAQVLGFSEYHSAHLESRQASPSTRGEASSATNYEEMPASHNLCELGSERLARAVAIVECLYGTRCPDLEILLGLSRGRGTGGGPTRDRAGLPSLRLRRRISRLWLTSSSMRPFTSWRRLGSWVCTGGSVSSMALRT